MTEAGWYDDYDDPSRLRWYDGTAWTAHTSPKTGHADAVASGAAQADAAAAAAAAAAVPANPGPTAPEVAPEFDDGSPASTVGRLVSLAIIGLLIGVCLGGCLFNGVGAITPVTEHDGTVRDIEIDFSTSQSSSNRRTYYISGTLSNGETWQIASEDAYRAVESEGWPQAVRVAIGDWTGTAERVTGRSFVVDHQTTGARIAWTSALVIIGVAGLVSAVIMARKPSAGGIFGALVFAFFLFVVGNWLGYQAVQWVQSG